MGSEDFYPEEAPVREVEVDSFWLDERAVTAAEFRRFVRETGYVTVAERPLEPADYPDADPALLVPGSLVFRPTPGPVPLEDVRNWWEYVLGAAGGSPAAPARPSTGATAIPSCRSRTRTRRPTRAGRARSCRRRPSGSTPPAAASRAPPSPGATSTFPADRPWEHLAGPVPWQNLRARRIRGDVAGRQLSAQRLRALRHDRGTRGSGRATGSAPLPPRRNDRAARRNRSRASGSRAR